jgi:hypothetical protein
MSDFNPFLDQGAAGAPPAADVAVAPPVAAGDPRVDQIAKAAGISQEAALEMIAAAEAFEQIWTAKGLPDAPGAMEVRNALCQAAQALHLGGNVSPDLLCDYIRACLLETARIGRMIEARTDRPVAAAGVIDTGVTNDNDAGADEDDLDLDDDDGDDTAA